MSTTYYLFFQYLDFDREFFDVVDDLNTDEIHVLVKALIQEFDPIAAEFNITTVRETDLDPVDKVRCRMRRQYMEHQPEVWLGDGRTPQDQRRAAAHKLSRMFRKAMSEPADASTKAATPEPAVAESTADQADPTKPVGGHVDGTAGSAPGAGETPHVPSRRHKAKWMAEAMLCVRDHPEWSDRKIAKEVGIDPAQLSRCKEYQAATKMARSGREPRQGYITSDPETGLTDVDAEINDPDPDI